ncbi:MAG TPA: Clp protease N-terminal domain-containing protein, partial [Oculatellaceae cyanobacterium]
MLDAFANKALSRDAHDILDRAFEEARLLNAQTVSSIHLLLVFFDENGKAAKYLKLFGKPLNDIRDAIKDASKAKSIEGDPTIDEELYELVNEAIRRASLYGLERAYTCHLFRALMTDATWSDKAFALMQTLKLDIDQHRLEADLRVKVFLPEVAQMSTVHAETETRTESESVVAAAASHNESNEVTQAPPRKLPFYENPSDYFSDATRALLQAAYRYAEDDRGSLVELSHLLRAFVYTSDSTISKLFTTGELRQTFARIALRVQSPLSTSLEPLEDLGFSTDVHLIIGTAFKDSRLFLREKIEPRDILLAIFSGYETRSLCAAFEFDELNGLIQTARRQLLAHSESCEADQATTYERDMGDATLYLTKRAYSVLVFAKESALQSKSPIILPAHLMFGVLRQAEHSEAGFVLARAADVLKVRELLDRRYGLGVASEQGAGKLAHFGCFARNVLRDARFQAKQMNIHTVDLHHLALALIRHAPDLVAEMSVVADLNVIALRKRIESCMMLQHQQWTNLGAAIL